MFDTDAFADYSEVQNEVHRSNLYGSLLLLSLLRHAGVFLERIVKKH